jgi:chromosomal replication initiation ATPase DnaA
MSDTKELLGAVKQFCKTLEKVGLKKVLSTLSDLYRDDITDYDDKIISFIVDESCLVYKISKEELQKSRLSGDHFDCRDMIMILIKNDLNLPHIEISKIFGIDNHVRVSLAISGFNNKNPRIREDNIFLENYKAVESKLIEYKKIIK